MIADPFEEIGDWLLENFTLITLGHLLALPVESLISFEDFAERLIQSTGLNWEARNKTQVRKLLHAAIEIYRRSVERLIVARGRDKYRQAAAILQSVKGLSKQLGTSAEWERFLTDLLAQHSRLPALQDELDKAGL